MVSTRKTLLEWSQDLVLTGKSKHWEEPEPIITCIFRLQLLSRISSMGGRRCLFPESKVPLDPVIYPSSHGPQQARVECLPDAWITASWDRR